MFALDKEVAALSRADCLAALKRIIPKSRINQVLRDCGKDQAFCPRLPAWSVVHFVLGLGLFCRDCYRQVFRWINPGTAVPGRSTLCEARHRVGVRPVMELARRTVKPLAEPTTSGAFYRQMRLVALDGFVVDVPDSPENARVFGRSSGGRAPAAFPQVRTVALCEVGTHVLYRWLSKPITCDERKIADRLLDDLDPGVLLLWDRNFYSFGRVRKVMGHGAHLLIRMKKKSPKLRPIRRLNDGSYLAKIYPNAWSRDADRDGILIRIIEYTFDDPRRSGCGQKHRLLTTLLDETLDPAATLIELYHDRWEEELVVDEVKTHQIERITLRSQTPAGVIQELNALLLDHFVVRALMLETARTRAIPPLRLSFTGTLKILRCHILRCPRGPRAQAKWWDELIAQIATETIEPRRNRVNPRVIKRKMSKWKKKRPEHRHYPQPEKNFHDGIVLLR